MDYLFDITAKRAQLSGDRLAMREGLDGFALTYAELNHRAALAAALLAQQGVQGAQGDQPGDRVAVLCRNRIDFFVLLFACAKLGAIMVPLNWRMPTAELAPLVADCSPALLIHGAEDRAVAADLIAAGHRIDLDAPGGWLSDELLPHGGRDIWPGDQPWYLLYTSGTTGTPKAVIQTYRMALVNHLNVTSAINLGRDDRTLNFLPLFHTAGINLYTLPSLIAGATVTVLPAFEETAVIDMLRGGHISCFFAVPAVYQALNLNPALDQIDLRPVRSWACGGAPLPDALIKAYAGRGVNVCNGFGMTETGPTAFLMDADEAPNRIGSVGRPQLLVQSRIMKPAGGAAEPGETGEIQLQGPGLTPGYWDRPDATAALYTEDGWLRTGDLAKTDEDGYVSIVGRLKEMFISGGENVYPAEVENVLARHPAVLEAAVVGIADDKWGEVGRAYILTKPGKEQPQQQELAAFCRERLAGYKVPKSFAFVTEFPRTAAGKVQKHLLAP